MAGYHTRDIPKGVYGSISKIREEVEELADAADQGNSIMELNELSDIVGAIQGYMDTMFPGFDISDLVRMAEATRRAFESGQRK